MTGCWLWLHRYISCNFSTASREFGIVAIACIYTNSYRGGLFSKIVGKGIELNFQGAGEGCASKGQGNFKGQGRVVEKDGSTFPQVLFLFALSLVCLNKLKRCCWPSVYCFPTALTGSGFFGKLLC